MLNKTMSKWEEMNVVHEVPDGWQNGCENCRYILEMYDSSDCFLYEATFDKQFHVMPRSDASPREENDESLHSD